MVKLANIAEAEQALAAYIPMVKAMTGRDITLERVQPLMAHLGNPQERLRIIHVAGTSGKTSTAYYLASLLQQAGKTAGLTVSPHIDTVAERIQVNLQPLAEEVFCRELGEFLDLIQNFEPEPSYFELLMALAYWYFAKIQVDYAVIETGFGGLHDASNIAQNPDKICVLTDIGYDHMHILGHTLEEIAAQKAGIMHAGNHAFTYRQADAVLSVFQKRADEVGATLEIVDEATERTNLDSTAKLADLPLYQQHNWLLAHHVYDSLAQRDGLSSLTVEQLNKSLETVVPGRMDIQQVGAKTLIMDGAHNGQKMEAFVESFQAQFPDQKAVVALCLKEGKEFQAVLPALQPITDQLILTTFKTSQDLPSKPIDPAVLADEARKLGYERVLIEPDYANAYQMLVEQAAPLGIVTGSFYLVATFRELMRGEL